MTYQSDQITSHHVMPCHVVSCLGKVSAQQQQCGADCNQQCCLAMLVDTCGAFDPRVAHMLSEQTICSPRCAISKPGQDKDDGVTTASSLGTIIVLPWFHSVLAHRSVSAVQPLSSTLFWIMPVSGVQNFRVFQAAQVVHRFGHRL